MKEGALSFEDLGFSAPDHPSLPSRENRQRRAKKNKQRQQPADK